MSLRRSSLAIAVALLIAQSALPLVTNAGKDRVCPLKCCTTTMCPLKTDGCAMRSCGMFAPQALPLFVRFAVIDERADSIVDHATIDYTIATPQHLLRGFHLDLEHPPRHSSLV